MASTTLEERVAYLEGRVDEHSRSVDGIRDALVHLEQRMDQRFASIDQRFAAIDQRFASIDQRFASLDLRLDSMDARITRQFTWLVGIQITTFVTMIGVLLTR